MGKRIRDIACALIVVIGVWQGLGQLGFFEECSGRRYYRLEEKISAQTAAAMRAKEEEAADMLLWDFLDGQTVSCPAPTGRTGKVSVVTVCGDPGLLTGNLTAPRRGDATGCLLDGGTAWKLFGTREAVGETVLYRGKEYRIKGILNKMEPTMLIQAPADYGGGFGRMTLSGGGAGDRELANRMRNRYGITLTKMDWGIVRTAVKLVFCGMSLSVCALLWRRLRGCRPRGGLAGRAVSAAGAAAGIALLLGLLWMTGIRGIPAEYIPPQWSDFAFYQKAWDNLGSAWENLLRSGLSTFELRMAQNSAALCLDIILTGAAARRLAAGPDKSL